MILFAIDNRGFRCVNPAVNPNSPCTEIVTAVGKPGYLLPTDDPQRRQRHGI